MNIGTPLQNSKLPIAVYPVRIERNAGGGSSIQSIALQFIQLGLKATLVIICVINAQYCSLSS